MICIYCRGVYLLCTKDTYSNIHVRNSYLPDRFLLVQHLFIKSKMSYIYEFQKSVNLNLILQSTYLIYMNNEYNSYVLRFTSYGL